MTSAGLMFKAHSSMRSVAALKCKKEKRFLNFGLSPTGLDETSLKQMWKVGLDAPPGRSSDIRVGGVLTTSYFFFFPSSLRELEPPSFSAAGLGLSVSHRDPRSLSDSMVHYCASHHEQPSDPRVGWRWEMVDGGGWDQLPHAESDYCAGRWLAQEANGPLIRCYITMACMQVKFRASRAGDCLLEHFPPVHASMQCKLDEQRIASLGPRRLRAQT